MECAIPILVPILIHYLVFILTKKGIIFWEISRSLTEAPEFANTFKTFKIHLECPQRKECNENNWGKNKRHIRLPHVS